MSDEKNYVDTISTGLGELTYDTNTDTFLTTSGITVASGMTFSGTTTWADMNPRAFWHVPQDRILDRPLRKEVTETLSKLAGIGFDAESATLMKLLDQIEGAEADMHKLRAELKKMEAEIEDLKAKK